MADATADQIKFAQSRIDYFEKVLKSGASDKIKQLVKATGKTKASDIADAIKNAKDIKQSDVDKAKKDATDAKKLLSTDSGALKTDLTKALTDIGELISKIGDANTAAGGIVADAERKAVTDPLGEASNDANAAQSKLSGIKIDDIAKKTGSALEAALAAAVKTVGEAKTSTDTAKTKLDDANTAAGNITEGTGTDETPTDKKTAVTNAFTDASTAVGAAEQSVGKVDTDGTQIEKDYKDYVAKQKAADGMKVETSPIMTVATDACPNIKAKTDATEAKVIDCFTEAFKGYGFINAILKNIPYKGADVLTPDTGPFSAPKSDIAEDNVKVLNSYAKIVATVCGTGPFVTGKEIPNPKDDKGTVTTKVTDCLTQANKIAASILADSNCGSDKLDSGAAVKADCYTALAGKTNVLFENVDVMKIDLSGKYNYDVVFPDLDSITV